MTGVAAVVAVLHRRRVCGFVLASLALTLAPLPAARVFGAWIEATGTGPWFRLGAAGLASILAMAAAVSYFGSAGGPARKPIPS